MTHKFKKIMEDIDFFLKKNTISSITYFFFKLIHFFKFIFLFIIYFNQAYSVELVNLRFGSNGEIKRIVLDLTQDTSFDSKVFDKRIEIFFKDEIEVNKKFITKNDLNEIAYNKKLKKLSLIFNKEIFSTNIYLLKKKKRISLKNRY